MGSRVAREAPKDLEKKKAKSNLNSADAIERSIRRQQEKSSGFAGHADILEATQELEGLSYRPRTAETREIYEIMLGSVHRVLGDQTQDVVRSAADAVLEVLKSDDLKEFDKKKEVESILGPIQQDLWGSLVNLGKKITDYGEDEEAKDSAEGTKGRALENEDGVAVVFEDDDDDDEDGDGEQFEVRGENSDDDDETDEDEDEDARSATGVPADDDEGALIIGQTKRSSKSKSKSDVVSPHDVDGFWLQRFITASYPDPLTANDLTTKALELLGSESDARDLENSLAELFGYENFPLIAHISKNRDVIYWCTRLARSNDDERHDVEVAMREKGVGSILRELKGDRTKTADDGMDVDGVTKVVPNKATLAPGSVAQPRRIVDIDSLVFSEGGHFMSKKKVTLPEGSFKREFKGYEEIHVPAPKKRVVQAGETPVKVSSMPSWTHSVFNSVKATQLNPIQSKVYPIAFETDEPMLICAPTGAGKVSNRDALS